MSKFYGRIGFGVTTEVDPVERPGVWVASVEERSYYGDVNRVKSSWKAGTGVNDDLDISNEISIVADPFAREHFGKMRYVEWMGQLWKITGVEVQHPRLILSIGGIYNGEQAEEP